MFVIKIKGWDGKNGKYSGIANSYLNSHMPKIRIQPRLVINPLPACFPQVSILKV